MSGGIPCPLCGNGRLHAPPSLAALEEAATKYYVIPRAHLEAYRAAAKALALARAWEGFATPNRVLGIIDQAIAALRAAGIETEEPKS